MARVLITTVPFGAHNHLPLDLLEAIGIDFQINPLGRLGHLTLLTKIEDNVIVQQQAFI